MNQKKIRSGSCKAKILTTFAIRRAHLPSKTMTRQIQLFVISLLASASTAYAQDFTAQDIKVENRQQGVTLAGTLTVPAEGKPKAAIILASGSGAQNRDEEILGHRPFKVIAEHLSGRGYAVLRMDDRGTGESEGDTSATTLDDYVADISCAIATLDSCLESITGAIKSR